MKIIIPSHNRSDSVKPLLFIPKSFYNNTYIVVRSGEQEQLYAKYKDIVNVVAIDNLSGIADKRDAICRMFTGEKIWMLDDDCILHNSILDEKKDIIKTTNMVNDKEFYEFIKYVDNLLDTYPHGVVRPALFARGRRYMPYRLNTWAFTNTLLNLSVLTPEDLDYTYVKHTEDAHAFLNIIDQGHTSFCLSKWMIKSDKPGKPGGMTDVRTTEMINDAHIKLNKKFPRHTKLKQGYSLKTNNQTISPIALVIRPKQFN
jgi:hypothetical protein